MEAVEPHPHRGPRGVQVRAGGHAGEEQRPLARRSRRSSRSTSRCAARSTPSTATTTADRLWRRADQDAVASRASGRRAAGSMDSLTPEELAQLLYQALMKGDDAMMRALARQAVTRYAGMEPGRPVGRHLLPVPHAAEPRPRRDARPAHGQATRQQAGGELTPLEERLEQRRVRACASTSSRRRSRPRSAGAWWPTGVSRPWPRRCASRCPRTSTSCTPAARRCSSLRKALQPLTRKLAARLARKRRHGRKGPLDFRNTVRHSLSLRRRAGRAQVQVPPPVQARAHGGGRHLGVGGRLRPLHPAPRVRHPGPVLEGALVRVHRRHRRGHRLLRGRRGHHRGGAPRQHRGRRGVGRRPLRLRPRLRGRSGSGRARRSAPRPRCCCSATPGTTTTPPRLGGEGDAATRPATCTG